MVLRQFGLLHYVCKINRDYFSQSTTLVKHCRELETLQVEQSTYTRLLTMAENALKAAAKRPRDQHKVASLCGCPECCFTVAFNYVLQIRGTMTDGSFNPTEFNNELDSVKSKDGKASKSLADIKVKVTQERRKSEQSASKTVYLSFQVQSRDSPILFDFGLSLAPVPCKSSDPFYAFIWLLYRRGQVPEKSLRTNMHFYCKLDAKGLIKLRSDQSFAPLEMSRTLEDVHQDLKVKGDKKHPIRIHVLEDRRCIHIKSTNPPPQVFGNLWTLKGREDFILKDTQGHLWNATEMPPKLPPDPGRKAEWKRFLSQALVSSPRKEPMTWQHNEPLQTVEDHLSTTPTIEQPDSDLQSLDREEDLQRLHVPIQRSPSGDQAESNRTSYYSMETQLTQENGTEMPPEVVASEVNPQQPDPSSQPSDSSAQRPSSNGSNFLESRPVNDTSLQSLGSQTPLPDDRPVPGLSLNDRPITISEEKREVEVATGADAGGKRLTWWQKFKGRVKSTFT